MATELAAGRLPAAVGVPDGGQASLPAEGPGEAVRVEVEQVLEVGLLRLPVHGGGGGGRAGEDAVVVVVVAVEADVVQGRRRQQLPRARLAGVGVVVRATAAREAAVERQPVELGPGPGAATTTAAEPAREERHPRGLLRRGEVRQAVVVPPLRVVEEAVRAQLQRRAALHERRRAQQQQQQSRRRRHHG